MKTHCRRGHSLLEPNALNPAKDCRLCMNFLSTRYYQRNKHKWVRYYQAKKDEISVRNRRQGQRAKFDALTKYGKDGIAQCCWPGCTEKDVDVLTIDHVNDDGFKGGQRGRGGRRIYFDLRRMKYPPGFQTLCANHNLKKEILRKRAKVREALDARHN